jgi:hypothetical protein
MKKYLSVSLMCCLCLLTILLAACGAENSSQAASTATPTQPPTPTQTQSSTPTPVEATATSVPTSIPSPTPGGSGKNAFVVYTGKSYTISYRPTWKIEPDGSDGVTFRDPTQTGSALHVIVQNTQYPLSALQIEEGTSLKDRCKPSRKVSATITINGITWNQGEFTCSSALAGGSDQEIRTLEMQKPIGNTYYSITYSSTPQNFDNAINGAFQIMTDSFKVQ